jgi:uncharacterized cupredoxin-like copper-binding protein
MTYANIKSVPAGRSLFAALLALSLSAGAHASGEHGGGHGHGDGPGHAHAHGPAIGQPGRASEVSRTIDMVMTDNRYSPRTITVRKGETVRFRVRNEGRVVHEFNIGTAAMHAGHRREMAMMVEHGLIEVDRIHRARMGTDTSGGRMMTHDDPNSVLLEPGRSAEMIWTFPSDARLEFACNLPGHYESGMTGEIEIR